MRVHLLLVDLDLREVCVVREIRGEVRRDAILHVAVDVFVFVGDPELASLRHQLHVVRRDLNQAAEGLLAGVDLFVETTIELEGDVSLMARTVACPTTRA